MSTPCQFENQFTIQKFPANAMGKLLPDGGSAAAIFARNRDYSNFFHLLSTISSVTVHNPGSPSLSNKELVHFAPIFEASRSSLKSILRLFPHELDDPVCRCSNTQDYGPPWRITFSLETCDEP